MPETTFLIPTLNTQDDADAVMFELQDLPCVNQADVDLAGRTAWVSHTGMISADDISLFHYVETAEEAWAVLDGEYDFEHWEAQPGEFAADI